VGSKVTLRRREGVFPNFLEGTALLWPFSTLGTVPGACGQGLRWPLRWGGLRACASLRGCGGKGWQLVVACPPSQPHPGDSSVVFHQINFAPSGRPDSKSTLSSDVEFIFFLHFHCEADSSMLRILYLPFLESPHRFVEILKWEKVMCVCV